MLTSVNLQYAHTIRIRTVKCAVKLHFINMLVTIIINIVPVVLKNLFKTVNIQYYKTAIISYL